MNFRAVLMLFCYLQLTYLLFAQTSASGSDVAYTSGNISITRYGANGVDVVLEGSYQFAAWGDGHYEFNGLQPTNVINQGIFAASDGRSTYQAATITPKVKTGNKADKGRSFARFERGPMPNAGIPSWGPTQGFILAHHILRMKKTGAVPHTLQDGYIPEVISVRGLELRAASVRGEVFDHSETIEVVFRGRVREAGAQTDRDYIIGRLKITQFSGVIPLSIKLTLYIPTNTFDDEDLLAEAELTGSLLKSPAFTPSTHITQGGADSVYVRDSRFPECPALGYVLTNLSPIPFEIAEAAPGSPANVARLRCNQLLQNRSTAGAKRVLLFGLYGLLVVAAAAIYFWKKNNIITHEK